jgi:hypothetical protein
MDSLHASLDLSGLRPVEVFLAALDPDMAATVRLQLPRTPLIHLLGDLYNLASKEPNAPECEALQGIARLAIARHEYTLSMFAKLTESLAQPSLEKAVNSLADLPSEDARLALQMLAFTADLLADAQLPDKAAFAFQIASSLADHFGLLRNRAIVLHQLGFFEERRGRLNAAEELLREASVLFAQTAPSLVRTNNRARARIYVRRLLFEDNPPAPDDFEALIASDPEIGKTVLPVLARKALGRDDFKAAENLLRQLRASLDPAMPPRAGDLLVEAQLARRLGRFEAAQMLIGQAETSENADTFRGELLREKLYFARDFDMPDEALRILAELQHSQPSVQLLYQDALVRLQSGAAEEAQKLFQECLGRADDDTIRANCFGMLGQIADTLADSLRYLYSAIGLYLKLGRKLDHAIALSHLAVIEIMHAAQRKEAGKPMLVISEFSRADRLLQEAQKIGETLGADAFVVTMMQNRAKLEWDRGRHRVALRHFDTAAKQNELAYLALSDRRQAEHFFTQNVGLYDQAVLCASAAGRPRDALLFSERGKARRLLRDAAEIAFERGALPNAEKPLLAAIQPLRARLLQGRPLSATERRTLHDAEEELAAMRSEGAEGRTLGWEELRPKIFGAPAPPVPIEGDEDIEELPGGGVIVCGRCKVYNRIGSSFCSACELPQPKTAQMNLNVALGIATAEEEKAALADFLYNRAVHLQNDGEFAQAEELLNQAMQLKSHPDYKFFHGLCRLTAGDAVGALVDFRAVKSLQYAGRYPFWPLPVSPDDLEQGIGLLGRDPTRTEVVSRI